MRSRSWYLVIVLTLLAAAFRFPTLSVQSFWFDEAATVRLLHLGFGSMIHELGTQESTPPLFYTLGWVWVRVFGESEAGVRSMSALLGTLAVPAAYLAARTLASRRAALVTAALVAVSPYLIWYSQEARSYALLLLLSVCSLACFGLVLERATPQRLALWALASILAVATHYFAFFLIVAETGWLMLRRESRRGAVAALVPVAAASGVVLSFGAGQRDGNQAWISEMSIGTRVFQLARTFLAGEDGSGFPPPQAQPLRYALFGLLAPLVLFGVWLLVRRTSELERRAALVPASLAGAVLALVAASGLVIGDYFFHRNVIVTWVPLAIMLAIGFSAERAGRAGAAAAVTLCAGFAAIAILIEVHPQLQRPNWRGFASSLASPPLDRAVVVAAGYDHTVQNYRPQLQQLGESGADVSEIDYVGLRLPTRPRPRPSAFRLVEAQRHAALMVVRYRAQAPQHVVPEDLDAPVGARLLFQTSAAR